MLKNIHIIIILLAYVNLVGHSIMPHHHHEGSPCFQKQAAERHETDNHTDTPPSNNDVNCNLNLNYVPLTSKISNQNTTTLYKVDISTNPALLLFLIKAVDTKRSLAFIRISIRDILPSFDFSRELTPRAPPSLL